MSDETATAATDLEPTGQANPVAPQQDPAEDKPDRRDQRYRERLRETEQTLESERQAWQSERTQMQQRIEAMQRREVERTVADRLADPGDLFRDGVQLADVLGEDGTIDADRLDAAVADCLARHPHYAPRPPAAAPSAAVTFGASRPAMDDEADSWTDAFRPKV